MVVPAPSMYVYCVVFVLDFRHYIHVYFIGSISAIYNDSLVRINVSENYANCVRTLG